MSVKAPGIAAKIAAALNISEALALRMYEDATSAQLERLWKASAGEDGEDKRSLVKVSDGHGQLHIDPEQVAEMWEEPVYTSYGKDWETCLTLKGSDRVIRIRECFENVERKFSRSGVTLKAAA